MRWFKRKIKPKSPVVKDDKWLPDDDPLTLAVNRAWNTGETVVWHEGDPLPDPDGPIRKVPK